ncbi:hypothetical protein ES332_A10G113400v1 [Gossypium tomentosum]|uniref:Uncharacterized protein n=1 Tax=Gossypium tomentosum TaxID=34277 RepID=A0A5D2NQY2_GOSTO|nr:hypothetical protein ES332_A10G113400v1 [Gossypium tomentosum]
MQVLKNGYIAAVTHFSCLGEPSLDMHKLLVPAIRGLTGQESRNAKCHVSMNEGDVF